MEAPETRGLWPSPRASQESLARAQRATEERRGGGGRLDVALDED